MPTWSKFRKVAGYLRWPSFLMILLRHRVAAASEHLEAIRFSAANTLIDAGANKGQFSIAFRELRPAAPITAFEPLPEAATIYERVFAGDPRANLIRVALSDKDGTARFHVADRSDSSSLLEPGVRQANAFGVRPAGVIEVPTRRLDSCISIDELPRPALLKVDVQGAELEVFAGCESLAGFDFIYVELSFIELYEGQPLFGDVSKYLAGHGFKIAGLYNQVSTEQYGPTQVDVLFKRADESERSAAGCAATEARP